MPPAATKNSIGSVDIGALYACVICAIKWLTFKRRRFFKQRVPSDWFFQGRISKKKLKGGSKNCAQGRRDAQRAKARGAKADSVYDADVSRDPKIDELVRSKTSVETGMKVLFEMFGSQDWFS